MTYGTARLYSPGETVPVSGQYGEVNTYRQLTGYEVTCVKGEKFPPTRFPGYTYKLVDATKHRL